MHSDRGKGIDYYPLSGSPKGSRGFWVALMGCEVMYCDTTNCSEYLERVGESKI
jgi:hypothetical protein